MSAKKLTITRKSRPTKEETRQKVFKVTMWHIIKHRIPNKQMVSRLLADNPTSSIILVKDGCHACAQSNTLDVQSNIVWWKVKMASGWKENKSEGRAWNTDDRLSEKVGHCGFFSSFEWLTGLAGDKVAHLTVTFRHFVPWTCSRRIIFPIRATKVIHDYDHSCISAWFNITHIRYFGVDQLRKIYQSLAPGSNTVKHMLRLLKGLKDCGLLIQVVS